MLGRRWDISAAIATGISHGCPNRFELRRGQQALALRPEAVTKGPRQHRSESAGWERVSTLVGARPWRNDDDAATTPA
jgi:hypothetical protein